MYNYDAQSYKEVTMVTLGNDEDGSFLLVGISGGMNSVDSMHVLYKVRNSLSSAISSSLTAVGEEVFLHSHPVSIDRNRMEQFCPHLSTMKANAARIWFQAFPRDKFCSETLQAIQTLLPCQGNAGVSKLLPFVAEQSTSNNLRIVLQNIDSKIYVNVTVAAIMTRNFVTEMLFSNPMSRERPGRLNEAL